MNLKGQYDKLTLDQKLHLYTIVMYVKRKGGGKLWRWYWSEKKKYLRQYELERGIQN